MKNRKWHKISAKDKVLGRLASRVSKILMGKHKVDYAAHEDNGDFVIVTDADKVKVTGKKKSEKVYFKTSRYPGNSKFISYEEIKKKKPEYIIYNSVKGMLPKNKIARRMLTRLKIYSNSDHPHGSQQPIDLEEENA
ncbi:MAG: 50S ribosomal protein L13 [Elusimicrobiota bacterium]